MEDTLVERLSRLVFAALFVIGFLGVIMASEHAGSSMDTENTLVSLIKEVRLAQEITAFNDGMSEDNLDAHSLTQVEKILAKN